MAERIGQRLGNYNLIRRLGQGGFAEVYLGEHVHLHTLAAVKILLTHLSHKDKESFHVEAQTIARLVHSHIVRVLDYGTEETIKVQLAFSLRDLKHLSRSFMDARNGK